ncbi:MAG: OsmC family protein [Methanoregula sp.]|jgi:putative redox protein|nr:OsmC family protein [Methanoregula sp.]
MKTQVNTGMTNPSATVTLAGGLKFVAKTNMGNEIFFEPSPVLGGSGKIPNPMEYYIAAIGGCAAIKTQIDLAALGSASESVEVQVNCTRSEALPQILKTIHVTFTLKGRPDDAKVAAVIRDVMTLHCPVAVLAAASADVTWEHRIVPL